jgi:hypothetical protein
VQQVSVWHNTMTITDEDGKGFIVLRTLALLLPCDDGSGGVVRHPLRKQLQ